ncbi:MAG: DUF3467 domain-containing protein [Candidatus Magasanikbacteria bacterium]|nr:DUF3467 domain-containing protein [Candidatus Magasanikbacteria bacterium]
MQIDQILYYLTGANVEFDEEQFVFNTMSNTIARRYVLSPKHAKRFFLLLQKKIEDYEKIHGELKTSLPEVQGIKQTSREFGFRDLQEDKDQHIPNL